MSERKVSTGRLPFLVGCAVGVLIGAGMTAAIGFKSTVRETDIGIVAANLHPWQISEATMEFIQQKGWTFLHDQCVRPGRTIRLAAAPGGDEIALEMLEEQTHAGGVSVYISKNDDSGQAELAQDLSDYLRKRFGERQWRL